MPRRWWVEEKPQDKARRNVDWAAPVRIVAVVTLLTTTLDLIADFIMAIKLGMEMGNFGCVAYRAAIAFFFFVAISAILYIVEWIDSLVTLKNNQETRWLCKLSRSLNLVFEEVPLPLCILIIFLNEPRAKLAQPAMTASCIKLVALVWGIVKFIKIKFCWFCLWCTMDHGTSENCRRCWTPKLIRIVMLIVNLCHIGAIVLTIINICLTAGATRTVPESEIVRCYP